MAVGHPLSLRAALLSRGVTVEALNFDPFIETCMSALTEASINQAYFSYDAYRRAIQTNFISSLGKYYQYEADNNATQKTDIATTGSSISVVSDNSVKNIVAAPDKPSYRMGFGVRFTTFRKFFALRSSSSVRARVRPDYTSVRESFHRVQVERY